MVETHPISVGNIKDPKERILALERVTRIICQAAGTDPADGTMMHLTAAVHMAMTYSRKSARALMDDLGHALGFAIVSAESFFETRVVPSTRDPAPAEPSNVVQLGALSTTEGERQRFEKWAGSMITLIERESFFIRSKGGEYVRPGMRMAWLAWQARPLVDAAEGKRT